MSIKYELLELLKEVRCQYGSDGVRSLDQFHHDLMTDKCKSLSEKMVAILDKIPDDHVNGCIFDLHIDLYLDHFIHSIFICRRGWDEQTNTSFDRIEHENNLETVAIYTASGYRFMGIGLMQSDDRYKLKDPTKVEVQEGSKPVYYMPLQTPVESTMDHYVR